MRKKLALLLFSISCFIKGQILFSDSYGTYTLNTYTTNLSSTNYANVNSNYILLNDGFKNKPGYAAAPNKPFHVPELKTTGWAVVYNPLENDTFLVSTSWIDTSASLNVNRFVITPVINNISAGSVLSWMAMSPDAAYPDGYEVYVTTNTTGIPDANSFSGNDRLFAIEDGNTTGGGEKNNWVKRGVSLAAYAGQNIKIAFRNASKNMYQLWIDDVVIENVSKAHDAGLANANIYKYNTIGTNGTVSCKVLNQGYSNISSITLNYSVNGGVPQSQSFNLSEPLTPYASTTLDFATPYNINTPGYHKLKIWVSTVNGNADQNNNNDSLQSFLTIMATVPQKTVLAEQFLGTDDGYSCESQDKLNALSSNSVITVNIHYNDSMHLASVNNLFTLYRKTNSTALIDRTYFNDINSVAVQKKDYADRINQKKSVVVPASVSIINKSYDSFSRNIIFTVKADFFGEVKGDYRINAYLTENNVYGPINDTLFNGWNPLNYLHSVPWSDYYLKGYYDPNQTSYVLSPKEFMHQKVLSSAPDGPFGVGGTIPTNGGTQGMSYTKTYTITLPYATNGAFRYNPENIYVVGFVTEYSINKNSRTILNATQSKLMDGSEIVGIKEAYTNDSGFLMYPNPTSGNLALFIPEKNAVKQANITVNDLLGKNVYTQAISLPYGLTYVNLNHLPEGVYSVIIETEKAKHLQKLIITR